jgi:hypothetical protein
LCSVSWIARIPPGDGAARERLDHVLALLPFAVLQVVQRVLQQREAVRRPGHAAGRIADCGDLLKDREIRTALDNLREIVRGCGRIIGSTFRPGGLLDRHKRKGDQTEEAGRLHRLFPKLPLKQLRPPVRNQEGN